MNEPQIIRTGQAAQLIGVSKPTLRKLAAEGTIPAIELPSGHLRFNTNELHDTKERLRAPHNRTTPRSTVEDAAYQSHKPTREDRHSFSGIRLVYSGHSPSYAVEESGITDMPARISIQLG